ncbi:MAG: threonine--tRNA ligase [Patescibacteria group bacterium]|nr:threonine--tRNA ligase [Patescibacteria group bacterium]
MPKLSTTSLNTLRHSTAHIIAAAVQELYPGTKFGIGPTIENGFYYDFDFPREITEKDLSKIEKKAREIIKRDEFFVRKEMSIDEAVKLFKELKQDYKIELLKDLKIEGEKKVSVYKVGKFTDLCRGPHVKKTSNLKIFKLEKIAGAYWRGDEKNKMLTRIYGTAFYTKKELEDYLELIKEAEKRDHRKLGKELGLFLIDSQVGIGLPMWLPKGALIWQIMEEFWYSEHLKNGYELVRTPHIGSRALWETSGHWGFYNESMYPPIEIGQSLKDAQTQKREKNKDAKVKEEYLLKPMNCPFHVKIYNSSPKSYRDLPIRWAEAATVYRYEKSGEISGLTRVRGFTQDDAHIICSKEQVEKELERVIDFITFMFSTFGFKDYNVYLALRNPKDKKKYAGHDEGWKFTQKVLEKVAKKKKLKYVKEEGEAVFYGPKLDFKIKDCIGREWQCSTLQFDFNLPERFDMSFINFKGKEERPYMLHRALFGSFERFIGLMIEHYAGAFPLWLSPTQVQVVPVGEKHNAIAKKLADILQEENIRVFVDVLGETVGYKIRKAEKEKVPYMIVIGDKEMPKDGKWSKGKMLNIRVRGKKKMNRMSFGKFIQRINREIKRKK